MSAMTTKPYTVIAETKSGKQQFHFIAKPKRAEQVALAKLSKEGFRFDNGTLIDFDLIDLAQQLR